MKNAVIIKGNRYGISIVLDNEMAFSDLLNELNDKLEKAERFFDSDKQLAITFEGRILSNEEMDQVLSVIKQNSKLNIQYVIEENTDLETTFYDIIQEAKGLEQQTVQVLKDDEEPDLTEANLVPDTKYKDIRQDISSHEDNTGLFYKGTLRSGQTLETKDSLVIIGDVNPGAKVIAGGNIVIIGTLKGSVTAGCNGNMNSFVMALSMEPIQIQIADIIARSSDTKLEKAKQETMIAMIVDNQICIEPISKATIQNIHF